MPPGWHNPLRWRLAPPLRAQIGPRSVVLECLAEAGRRNAPLRVVEPCGDDPEMARPHEAPPAQALQALSRALAAMEGKVESLRGRRCDVVIEDCWMLYDVVRADLDAMSSRAATALVTASLADLSGAAPTELHCRWHRQGRSAQALACAIPADLVPALTETLSPLGLRLGTVEGELVAEYNRRRAPIEPRCAVIAVVRAAGTQLAAMVDGIFIATSFEAGIQAAPELETRARGMLRTAASSRAAFDDAAGLFYAIAEPEWRSETPWVILQAATDATP